MERYEKRLAAKRAKDAGRKAKAFTKAFLSNVPEVDADIALHFNFVVVGPAAKSVIEATTNSPAALAMQQGHPTTPTPDADALRSRSSRSQAVSDGWACSATAASAAAGAADASLGMAGTDSEPKESSSPRLGRSTRHRTHQWRSEHQAMQSQHRCLVAVGENRRGQGDDEQAVADNGKRVAKLSFAPLALDEEMPLPGSRLEALSTVIVFALYVDSQATEPWGSIEDQLELVDRAIRAMRGRCKAKLRPVRTLLLCSRSADDQAVVPETWAAALSDFESSHGHLWKFGPVLPDAGTGLHDDGVYAEFSEMVAARAAQLSANEKEEVDEDEDDDEDADAEQFRASSGLEETSSAAAQLSRAVSKASSVTEPLTPGGRAAAVAAHPPGRPSGGSLMLPSPTVSFQPSPTTSIVGGMYRSAADSTYTSEGSEAFQAPRFDTERYGSEVSESAVEYYMKMMQGRPRLEGSSGSILPLSRDVSSIPLSRDVSINPGPSRDVSILSRDMSLQSSLLPPSLSGISIGLLQVPGTLFESEGGSSSDTGGRLQRSGLDPAGFNSNSTSSADGMYRSNRTGSSGSVERHFATDMSMHTADSVASTAVDNSGHIPMVSFQTELSGSSVASSAVERHLRNFDPAGLGTALGPF